MIHGGKLREMREVLYNLKRAYGLPLGIYTQTSSVADIGTGAIATSRTVTRVDRAIILPSQIHKSFKYDIGYLKANSNFTYGGFFSNATRQVLIDGSDLPRDFTITAADTNYIVYEHKRYAIKSVAQLDLSVGFFISMEWTSGVPTNEIHEIKVVQRLGMTQTAGGLT